VACIVPSLFWLAYWVYRAHLGKRRLLPVVSFFGTGLLAGPLALGLFALVEITPFYAGLADIGGANEVEKFVYSFFAIGPVEELAKFLVAWATLRVLADEVDQVRGGLVIACASALGFATIENIYFMTAYDEVIWHRALTLPFNHVLFSSFWGVGLSLYRIRPANGALWLTSCLVLSFVFHGLYDYILLSEHLSPLLVVPLILVIWCPSSARASPPRRGGGTCESNDLTGEVSSQG
jgi:RsiW-degrading membrane proteinase PrsW (M82 family)